MISVAKGAGIGVSVTYHVMTRPGRRNMGPPYSQAQLPGGSWSLDRKERALVAEANVVLAVGRSGRFYT